MNSWYKATIPEIIHIRIGSRFNSKDFILDLKSTPNEVNRLRIHLENIRDHPDQYEIICSYCHKPLMLRGGGFEKGTLGKKRLHFTHAYQNANCPYQNGTTPSRLELNKRIYHGLREGPEHRLLKQRIADCLAIQSNKFRDVQSI